MEVIIKRSEWIRGQGSADSYLYRQKDDKKCCLGFVALKCGIVAGRLLQQSAPAHILRIEWDLPQQFTFLLADDRSTDSLVANELMVINDTPIGDVANVNQYNPYRADFQITSEEHREDKIAEILAGHGFEVSFVD